MAEQTNPGVKATLGLTGVTMNAMALIAPGAFLWITYQLQAAATAPDGSSVANDMFAGIGLALAIALLTAISYGQLAGLYPEAGFGSAYYFAEKAFLDREDQRHHRFARIAKLATGWAAHLFYWVYPGVMVAMMATLLGYMYTAVTGATLSTTSLVVICAIFAVLTGWIAARGVTGSTMTSIIINAVQLTTLVIFSLLAIYYRWNNPGGAATEWSFSGAWDIVRPHSLTGVTIQSTIAILILVGFESCTAFAAESINPQRDIPRAVVLSLIVQGVFAYGLEYFAANYMLASSLTGTDATGAAVNGMAAAAASSAPIGDMAVLLGNTVLGGIGFGLMMTIAVTVALAVLGTTLSCLNTAVRVTYAMAQDDEMPGILNAMHGRFATPHRAIWVLVAVSILIGAIGVQSVVGLLGITLASNFGTFVLYALTCLWTIIAFAERHDRHVVKHYLIPALGLITNVGMLGAILYLYIIGNDDARHEAYICFAIAGGWALISALYVIRRSSQTGKPIIANAPRAA